MDASPSLLLVLKQLMKFHAIIHTMQDILLFGVPSEFDTGSNKSHHKPSKYAAKLTQRNEATFNFQTAKCLTEFLVLDHACGEVFLEARPWLYFHGVDEVVDARLESLPSDVDEEAGKDADVDDVVSGLLDLSMDSAASAFLVGGGDGSGSEMGRSGSDMVEELDADLVDELEADELDLEPCEVESESDEVDIHTGGTQIEIFLDADDDDSPAFRVLGRSKSVMDTTWGVEVLAFLVICRVKLRHSFQMVSSLSRLSTRERPKSTMGIPISMVKVTGGTGRLWIGEVVISFQLIFGVL